MVGNWELGAPLLQQEGHRPVSGVEQPQAPVCAGGHPPGKQLGLGVLVDTRLTMNQHLCPCCKEGEQCPGLH